MSVLLLLAVVAADLPADVRAKPKLPRPVVTSGERDPGALFVIKKKKQILEVTGPAVVKLTLHALNKPGKPAKGPPSKIAIRVPKQKPRMEKLDGNPAGFGIERLPLKPGAARVVELTLGKGKQTITLLAQGPAAKTGYLLGIAVQKPGAAPPPAPPPVEPALPEPELPAPPTLAAAPTEPALPGDEPPLAGPTPGEEPALAGPRDMPEKPAPKPLPPPGVDLPEIAGSDADIDIPEAPLNVTEAAHQGRGFTWSGPPPPEVQVAEPTGVTTFHRMGVDPGLLVEVGGPGTMVFDVHAFRSEVRPETLAPVVIGMLVDDVLIQTVSLEQDVNPAFSIVGSQDNLSERVTLRLPIPTGNHRAGLSLSDSASLGLLVRPRFDDVAEVTAPDLPPTLVTAPARPTVVGSSNLAFFAGAYFSPALPVPGPYGQLEANLGFPLANQAVSIGLAGGFAYLDFTRRFADDRDGTGQSSLRTTLMIIPALADLRWTIAATSWLKIALGAGGGVIFTMGSLRSRGVNQKLPVSVTGTGAVHLDIELQVGPGDLFVRGMYLPSPVVDSGSLRNMSPGGASAALGYAVRL